MSISAASILRTALGPVLRLAVAEVERRLGRKLSLEEYREALVALAHEPPPKTDFGQEWADTMARMRAEAQAETEPAPSEDE